MSAGQILRALQMHGLRHGSLRMADRLTKRVLPGAMRATSVPHPGDSGVGGSSIYRDARSLTGAILGDAMAQGDVEQRIAEIESELADAGRRTDLDPRDLSIGPQTALLLYLLVRAYRPRLVLETGVANGRSSTIILNALQDNGDGRLVSLDIDARAGALVPDRLRARWELRIMKPSRLPHRFTEATRDLHGIELFLHDSDHHYRWMSHEFDVVESHLAPGAWIAANDANENLAFLDLCRRVGSQPHLLSEGYKLLGLTRMPGCPASGPYFR